MCGNALQLPIDRVDEAVLGTLATDVLRPRAVMAVIEGVLARLAPKTRDRDLKRDRAEIQNLDREIGRLTEAVATGDGGSLPSVVEALQGRQARRETLAASVAARSIDLRVFNRHTVEQGVRRHLERWQTLLTARVEVGRQLLRETLVGPLTFTPDARTYRFEGELSVGRLLAGMTGLPTFLASLMPASWNQIAAWLDQIDRLRRAA